MLSAGVCGIGTEHSAGFIYKTESSHKNVLIFFRTPYFLVLDNKRYDGQAGDVVLHRKGDRVIHGAISDSEIFMDDWIYFDDPDDVLTELNIPINTTIKMGSDTALTHLIERVMRESIRKDIFSKRLISDTIYRILVTVKRAEIESKSEDGTQLSLFKKARLKILNSYKDEWTLEKMTDLIGYSQSRFCYLYSEYFGISPMNDLINKRIEIAKQLLELGVYKVSEIASLCGFSSIHYFSNCFKKATGKSPKNFYK